MFSNDILDKIKADPSLGAGNFLYKLRALTSDIDKRTIYLSQPYKDHHGNEHLRLSVKDILALSDELSNWYSDNGVRPKDPVALFFEDGICYYIHYFALTSLGAIPTHINPNLNMEIAARFAEKTDVTLVIVDNNHFKIRGFIDDAINIVCIDDIKTERRNRKAPLYTHDNNDPVMLVHTSGTTGIPKAVRSDHYSMAFGVLRQLKGNVGTRILNILPHSHGSGLTIMMSALLRGAEVYIQTQREPDAVFTTLQQFTPDLVIAFPKTFVDMCRHDLNNKGLECVSFWLAIGDANHEPHIKKLIQFGSHVRKGEFRNGSVFIDNLGSSEIAYAAFKNTHSLIEDTYGRDIGTPFDWMEVAILDDHGNKVPDNTVGMIGLKSETLTKGYWSNSYLTEKNRLSGYWLTGDLAYRTQEGRYIHMDRITDKIKTREGLLYSCFTEELIMSRLPEVFECSIFGIKKNDDYEEPAMALEIINSEQSIDSIAKKINLILKEERIPQIHKVMQLDHDAYTGVTGKKLKRRMREEISLHA